MIGGQAIDTIPLAFYLQKNFEILILSGEKENNEVEANFLEQKYSSVLIKKIHFFKRSINPFNDVIAFFKIKSEIKKFGCDIIHTHGAKPGVIGRLAGKMCGVKCLVHTFHGHLFHSYYNNFVSDFLVRTERRLSNFSDKIIAISNSQKEELVNKYKVADEKKIAVIQLGVDENVLNDEAACKRKLFREKYLIDNSCIAIGIAGRLVAIKNCCMFINVAGELLKTQKRSIKFFIIGDGVLRKKLEKYCGEKHIKYNAAKDNFEKADLIFTSWIAESSNYLHGLDIVALTSNNEGTPLSLIEAQMCGKPVIATNAGGSSDTFINNETGFLVEKNNDSEFCNKLQQLINDDTLRYNMGQNAKKSAVENFSKEKEVQHLAALYNELLNKKEIN